MISFFGFTLLTPADTEKLQWQTVMSTEQLKSCREEVDKYRKDALAFDDEIYHLRNEVCSLGQMNESLKKMISEQSDTINRLIKQMLQNSNHKQTSEKLFEENLKLNTQLNAQTGYLKSISEPIIRMYAGNPSLVSPTLVHAVESLLVSLDPHGRLRDG